MKHKNNYFRCLLFLFAPFGLITSCNKPSFPDGVKIELLNSNCNVTGLKEVYQYNEDVSLQIDPISDLYYRPLASNLGVYGINKFNYNEDNGTLIFKITNNVTLDVKAEPKYGKEVTRTEFSALFGADPLGEIVDFEPKRKISFQTYTFWWDFSSVSKESTKTNLFIELAKLGLNTDELYGYRSQTELSESEEEPALAYTYAYNEEGFNSEFEDSSINRYFIDYTENGIEGVLKFATASLNKIRIFENYPAVPALVTFRMASSNNLYNGTILKYTVHFDNYEFNDDKLNGYLQFKGNAFYE